MKKYFVIILMLSLVAVVLAPGCKKKKGKSGPPAPAKAKKAETPMEEAARLLKKRGVDPSSLKQDKRGNLSITVETSETVDYDAHLIVQWGSIFGTLAWYAKEYVIINNTVNGEFVLRIAARVEDILDFQRGVTSEEEFFSLWQYRSVNRGASGAAQKAPPENKVPVAEKQPARRTVRGESCNQNLECESTIEGPGNIQSAQASSTLENSSKYAAGNIADSKLDHNGIYSWGWQTAWCEGVSGTGSGQSVTVNFKQPQKLSAVLISAGYDKAGDLFLKNSRLKSAVLELSDGSTYQLQFMEHFFGNDGQLSYTRIPGPQHAVTTNSPQIFKLGGTVTTQWLKLTIGETIRGEKYEDTCVSTIERVPALDWETNYDSRY